MQPQEAPTPRVKYTDFPDEFLELALDLFREVHPDEMPEIRRLIAASGPRCRVVFMFPIYDARTAGRTLLSRFPAEFVALSTDLVSRIDHRHDEVRPRAEKHSGAYSAIDLLAVLRRLPRGTAGLAGRMARSRGRRGGAARAGRSRP